MDQLESNTGVQALKKASRNQTFLLFLAPTLEDSYTFWQKDLRTPFDMPIRPKSKVSMFKISIKKSIEDNSILIDSKITKDRWITYHCCNSHNISHPVPFTRIFIRYFRAVICIAPKVEYFIRGSRKANKRIWKFSLIIAQNCVIIYTNLFLQKFLSSNKVILWNLPSENIDDL